MMMDAIQKKKRRNNAKIFVFVLSGTIMIGHGLRMIYQGTFNPGSAYVPNLFDLYFDWLTLAVLGGILFWLGISTFYRNLVTNQSLDKESKKDKIIINSPT